MSRHYGCLVALLDKPFLIMQAAYLFVFGFVPLSLILVLVMYARSRKREGLRPFELTTKDKSQFKEMREDLTPARLLARFLGSFGMLFLVASFYPFDTTVSWGDRFIMVGLGVGLIALTICLVKPRSRPRWWWAVTWGMAASACFVLLVTCMIITYRTPVSHGHHLPGWLLNSAVLAMVIGVPSALLCLIYGAGVLLNSTSELKVGIQNPPVNQSVD